MVKVRRDYNNWVANQTLEDYALRFTPRRFRQWSVGRVANTAFGGSASFLVLEAIGAAMLVSYGFENAFWAILATGLIIFLFGLPICAYASRYGLDMDLLTRGAGFGYLGSTITSLIYASFTFIFFALEAAIMAYAIELFFGIPPWLGYILCALLVVPLVAYGISSIGRLQAWTQPLWLVLLALPFAWVLLSEPGALAGLSQYGGRHGNAGQFNLLLWGAALTVGLALITQIGEQADYLRFMPERSRLNRRSWWLAVAFGGSGWVVLGVFKMLGGAVLAYLAIRGGVALERAVDPNQMYLAAYRRVFDTAALATGMTALFVVVSQLKINVTNAYAGSLAWSNFFARLTHSHPGRVVWMVFNTLIALVLMELDLFHALERVLGLYANLAISWMAAVVADLVINKPLGLSPPGIEFRRAYLYDINPVGVGAMSAASLLSIAAHLGLFGDLAQAFSALIALLTALVVSPLIAWRTRGRFYVARYPDAAHAGGALRQCTICERHYEADDMAQCPAYGDDICSLCCSLDARCHDLCKPQASLATQWATLMRKVLPRALMPYLESGLGHYLLLLCAAVPGLALLMGLLYLYVGSALGPESRLLVGPLQLAFTNAFAVLVLVTGVVAWWLVLTHRSRQVAQDESNRQTHLLMREIELHRQTDEQLQAAKAAADLANQAKSRYITTISHELRTPLNSILGYAQILDGDPSIPAHRKQAVRVIRRSGDHLLSMIEGTLDIARIEAGKLTLDVKALDFREFVMQIVRMFEQQASAKGLQFVFAPEGSIPAVVRADEKRLRQILLNILSNAVKYTVSGAVHLRVRYALEIAHIEIEDTGPGIAEGDLQRIFEPFVRADSALDQAVSGTGLGLTISRMLVALMGGELTVGSVPGEGTCFRIKLFLPHVHAAHAAHELPRNTRIGYLGTPRRVLVVDNEAVDREFLASVLQPLGFIISHAGSGQDCLDLLDLFKPDLILLDLAMPGMDGWETLRRIRASAHASVHVAIVSANAFDKGLENDLGIDDQSFILKPVRVSELLDWMEHALELEWIEAPVPVGTGPDVADLQFPSPDQVQALAELLELGYMRGILEKLDEIEAQDVRHAGFVATLREMAQRFQFDEMSLLLKERSHAATT